MTGPRGSGPRGCLVETPQTATAAGVLECILVAGSLEAAYSLNWGAREIWGKGGGETLALL